MQDRIDDYLSFGGVKFIWILNPRNSRGYICTLDGMREVKDAIPRTSNPDVAVTI